MIDFLINWFFLSLQTGRHLIIPETNSAEISEQLKIARGKLQLVPNKMFEELVMDLYDEVDRRECEASECQKQLMIN